MTRLALAAVLLLSGCAISPPELAAPRPIFFIAGKIAARPDNAPARALSFEWRRLQTADGKILDRAVFSRHGVTVAQMEITPEKVEVKTARGVFEGENLPAEHLGVDAPVRALGFWLRGESDPSVSARETTRPDGAVSRIRQHGWDIVYAERDAAGRPTRLEATFPGGTAVVRVRPAGADGDDS